MSDRADFYVYVLFRESGVPFYVGKGWGRRWLHHERDARAGRRDYRCNIIRQMFALGFHEIPKIKLHEGLTDARAYEYEQALIAAIGRRPHGPLVNLTNGGEGVSGLKQSPEHRAKLSAAARNRSPEYRANLRARKHSPEAREKMAAAARRRGISLETRAKINAANRGRKHSPETRAKMSAAHRGQTPTPETRAKLSAAKRGQEFSAETKAKISATLRGRKLPPETRAKMSAVRRGRTLSPESKAKIAAAARKQWAAQHAKTGQLGQLAG